MFGGLIAAVILASSFGVMDGLPGPVIGLGMGVVLLGLLACALWLFNRGPARTTATPDELARDLAARGLLADAHFEVRRAFAVEEFEDEGSHYYLELIDGRVLFLTGQYLYDYEPVVERGTQVQARRFPCTRFTIRRHRTESYVVDLDCGGEVVEPELVAPPFDDLDLEGLPEDGLILESPPYDAIKTARTRGR